MRRPTAASQLRVDLLTVIAHELGHHAGLEHQDSGLMGFRLSPRERHLPAEASVSDTLFAAFGELGQVFGMQ